MNPIVATNISVIDALMPEAVQIVVLTPKELLLLIKYIYIYIFTKFNLAGFVCFTYRR